MDRTMPPASLSVSGLPRAVTEEDLLRLFGSFGPIVQTRVVMNNDINTVAVVIFAHSESAHCARHQLNGLPWAGRCIKIDWTEGGSISPPVRQQSSAINSIYVRFSARKTDPVTRDELFRAFTPYGLVTEINVKDCTVDPRSGRQSGLVFVHYESTPDGFKCALRAVSGMDGATIDGVHFKVEPSRNLSKQFSSLQQAASVPRTSAAAGLFTNIQTAPCPDRAARSRYLETPTFGLPTRPMQSHGLLSSGGPFQAQFDSPVPTAAGPRSFAFADPSAPPSEGSQQRYVRSDSLHSMNESMWQQPSSSQSLQRGETAPRLCLPDSGYGIHGATAPTHGVFAPSNDWALVSPRGPTSRLGLLF